jgi:hypothetical protein
MVCGIISVTAGFSRNTLLLLLLLLLLLGISCENKNIDNKSRDIKDFA